MNIYCFSTLSFAKLQFKSVINKAFHKHGVASFTDAWIETAGRKLLLKIGESHLLQMRGLKQCRRYCYYGSERSHLLQMRGLKLRFPIPSISFSQSHLLQMRGLKRTEDGVGEGIEKSHLLQMRGLKLFTTKDLSKQMVASFTDAWIETVYNTTDKAIKVVASFTDAWIETGCLRLASVSRWVASFTDAWIETYGYLVTAKNR